MKAHILRDSCTSSFEMRQRCPWLHHWPTFDLTEL